MSADDKATYRISRDNPAGTRVAQGPGMRRAQANEWVKLPGLFFRWEFSAVIHQDSDEEFRAEQVGYDDRGAALFAIYHRPLQAKESE